MTDGTDGTDATDATSDLELITVWDTDSLSGVDAFPAGTAAFLDYDDGNPVGSWIRARFPDAIGITITTVAADNNFAARMCDTEASGFTPEQAAYWAHMKLTTRHERPTIYVEISQKPDLGAGVVAVPRKRRAAKEVVEGALLAYGLEWGRDVDCFYAWWNGDPNVRQGIFNGVGCGVGNVGHQYANNGVLYDISVAYKQWVLGPWPVPPAPAPRKGDAMLIAVPQKLVPGCKPNWLLNGCAYFNLWDEGSPSGVVTTYAKGFDAGDASKFVKAGFPVAEDTDGGLLNRAAGHVTPAA